MEGGICVFVIHHVCTTPNGIRTTYTVVFIVLRGRADAVAGGTRSTSSIVFRRLMDLFGIRSLIIRL